MNQFIELKDKSGFVACIQLSSILGFGIDPATEHEPEKLWVNCGDWAYTSDQEPQEKFAQLSAWLNYKTSVSGIQP